MNETADKRPGLLLALMVALLLLSAALRFHRLGAQSLWYDEGVAYAHSLRSLPELIPHLQRNVHLPAYFTLLGWWQDWTGSSEFALRSLSALFSIVSIAWTYALGARLFHPGAGLAAAALVTLNSFSIYYAQEARMYAMLAAIAGGSFWLCVGLLRGLSTPLGPPIAMGGSYPPRSPRSNGGKLPLFSLIALGLVNALGLYTHVAYALVILAQALVAALWLVLPPSVPPLRRGEAGRETADSGAAAGLLMRFAVANLLTLLLFAPWLPVSLRQVFAQPNLSQALPLDQTLRQILGHFAYGNTFEHNFQDMTFFVYFFLLFGLIPTVIRRRALWDIAIPVAWVIVSLAIYLYLGLTTRYLRFLLPAQMAFALWLGRGVWMAWRLHRRDWATRWRDKAKYTVVLGLAFTLLPFLGNLGLLYYHPAFQRDDVRGLVARIEDRLGEEDAVLVSAAGLQEVLSYYYTGEAPVYALPSSSDEDATRSQVRAIIDSHDRIQVIFYGAAEQDPKLSVETTLNREAFAISDEWVDDLRYLQYSSPQPLREAIRVDAQFGADIRLHSYALSEDEPAAGDLLLAELVWMAEATPRGRYKVFLQLLDGEGALVAQRDSEPAGGSARTTNWLPGETVVDKHGLLIPADLPAGDYTLIAGLYDIDDPGARLPVGDSSYVNLGIIEVTDSG